MTTFLLDANLSPKIARFLATEFGYDVLSLQLLGLGDLPDHDVLRRARLMRRVIITLDRDFARFADQITRPSVGVIYLNLPNSLRYTPEIKFILRARFKTPACISATTGGHKVLPYIRTRIFCRGGPYVLRPFRIGHSGFETHS